ncbi:hypothetical protein Tco_0153416 [Tanacetum coccineum]
MTTTNSRIEGKKPSELMLSTQLRIVSMLETFPFVEDVDYIIQDLAVLCVRFATSEELEDYINTPNWNCPAFYEDDDDEEESSIPLRDMIYELPLSVAITPFLSTEEPDNFLSMGKEHLDTIPEIKSDEVIKSSVEDLIFFDPNDDSASSHDNPLYSEDIDYVDASSPDSELVSLEEVKDFDPKDGEINTDILLTIKDDILCKKLLNVNLLIAKIEVLKDNPTPSTDSVLKSPSLFPYSFLEETDTFDNSLPESEIFCFDMEEKRSGNPTSYSGLSLPDYEAFYYDSEPDSGNFTIDVVEDIFDNQTKEPRVYVPNVLPTHPTLYLVSNFTPSDDSLGSDLIVSFPSGTRNRIFDPGIFCEVLSKRFLSPNEFSISFIRDPLSSVFDTLLPFSSENEEKDFNPSSLSSNEAKSPLFAYVVWIFLPFLTYPVAPPYLLSSENEDTVFDPGISIYHSFMPNVSYRSGTFMKFNVYLNHSNESNGYSLNDENKGKNDKTKHENGKSEKKVNKSKTK